MDTKRWRILAAALLTLALASLVPMPVHADTILTLSSVSGTPGSFVTVSGAIANNGASTVYLNGENFTLLHSLSLFLNADTTDFYLNAPFYLDPGASSGSIGLFTFDIAPGTSPGTYSGNFLHIMGGGSFDYNDVASAPFSIDVQGTSAVPEPPSLLLCLGLVTVVCGVRLIRSYVPDNN